MTTPIGKYDWIYLRPRAWPELPQKIKTTVHVGAKYVYTAADVAKLYLGEDLPKLPNQDPMHVIYLGWPKDLPVAGPEAWIDVDKQLSADMRKRYEGVCIPIFVRNTVVEGKPSQLIHMRIPSVLSQLLKDQGNIESPSEVISLVK